jgi:hypothetical protein
VFLLDLTHNILYIALLFMERMPSVKRFCGIFGEQLIRGDLTIVQKHRIFTRDSEGKENYTAKGLLDPGRREIAILRGDSPEEKIQTVIHELFHNNFPEACEDEVVTQTTVFYQALTPRHLGFFEFMIEPPPEPETVIKPNP